MPDSIQTKFIHIKVCGSDPKDVIRSGGPVFMVRLYGSITGVKHFEDKRTGDPKISFIGEFVAEGNGKVFESDKAYFFKSLEEKLEATFVSGGDKAVDFAYDIMAVPDAKASTGYSYQAKSLIPTSVSDNVSRIKASLAQLEAKKTLEGTVASQLPAEPVTTVKGNAAKAK